MTLTGPRIATNLTRQESEPPNCSAWAGATRRRIHKQESPWHGIALECARRHGHVRGITNERWQHYPRQSSRRHGPTPAWSMDSRGARVAA